GAPPPPNGGSGTSGAGTTGGGTTGGGSTGGGTTGGGTTGGTTGGACGAACKVDSNTLVLKLADHPEIASANGVGFYTDNRYSDPICGGNVLAVVNQGGGKFSAFSASCTHQCCQVSPTSSGFQCPCHFSQYDVDGKVLIGTGPAYRNLPPIPVCADACSVYLQLA
ncbi:MAG: QcrA and Rieske domain-containing protein, partial [Deltaproteobacteria bacterium]